MNSNTKQSSTLISIGSFLIITTIIIYFSSSKLIEVKSQIGLENISFEEFYIEKIKQEYLKRKDELTGFPLYEIVLLHEKNVVSMEKEGYSRDIFDNYFSKWLVRKYGIIYKKDLFEKKDGEYLLKLGSKDINKKIKVIEKKHYFYLTFSDLEKKSSTISRIKNVTIPKYSFYPYRIEDVGGKYLKIKPFFTNQSTSL